MRAWNAAIAASGAPLGLGEAGRHQVGEVVRDECQPVVGKLGHHRRDAVVAGQGLGRVGGRVEGGGDRCGVGTDEQRVVGERIRTLLVGDFVDRHAAVLADTCLEAMRLGLLGQSVQGGLCRRAVGDPDDHDHARHGRLGHRVGRLGQLVDRQVGDAERHASVEPRRDVLAPAEVDLRRRHQLLVDELAELVVQRPIEVDALDRREASQELTEGGVLLG